MAFKNHFNAGELDKWCLGAIDDPAYKAGVAWLENFNLIRTGGINRRKGYKYIKKILEGANDGAVKLIPYSYGGDVNYVIYISKSKYGYIKFNGYDMDGGEEHEWPPAPGVPEGRKRVYKNKDPAAHYSIKESTASKDPVEQFTCPEGVVFAPGDRVAIGGNGVQEEAVFEITAAAASERGRAETVSGFSVDLIPVKYSGVLVQPERLDGDIIPVFMLDSRYDPGEDGGEGFYLTADVAAGKTGENFVLDDVVGEAYQALGEAPPEIQTPTSPGVSYFDEEGAGSGLALSCQAEATDSAVTYSFQVLNGGSGFKADIGGDYTYLRLYLENEAEPVSVKAVVGNDGSIYSVQSVKTQAYPAPAAGNAAIARYNAPPIVSSKELGAGGEYTEISTVFGNDVSEAAAIHVWVNEVDTKEAKVIGKVYDISFGKENVAKLGYGTGEIEKGGMGYEPLDGKSDLAEQPYTKNWVDSVRTYDTDLKISGTFYYGAKRGSLSVTGTYKTTDITSGQPPAGAVEHDLTAAITISKNANGNLVLSGHAACGNEYSGTASIENTATGCALKINLTLEGIALFEGAAAKDFTFEHTGYFTTFLEIKHFSEVSGERCARALRCVAEVTGAGKIKKIKSIPYWIDDDVVLKLSDTEDITAIGSYADCIGKAMASGIIDYAPPAAAAAAPAAGDPFCYMIDPASIDPKKTITDTEKARIGIYKGTAYTNYEDNEKAAIKNHGYARALYEFGGTWYSLDFKVGANNLGIPAGKRYECGGGTYPVCNTDHFSFSMYAAGGAPKKLSNSDISSVIYLQYASGESVYTVPWKNRLNRLKLIAGTVIDRWYIPSKVNVMDDDGNCFDELQSNSTGNVLVEKAESLKGSGASIKAEALHIPPAAGADGYGNIQFTLTPLALGKNYFERNIKNIVLCLKYREAGGDFTYTVTARAKRGTNGALVLLNPDGSLPQAADGSVVYTVPAQISRLPPDTGDSVTLTNAAGKTAGAKAAVTPVLDTAGNIIKWDVSLTIPLAEDGGPDTGAFYKVGDTLTASYLKGRKEETASVTVQKIKAVMFYNGIVPAGGGGKFRTDVSGAVYSGVANGKRYTIVLAAAATDYTSRSTLTGYGKPAPVEDGVVYRVEKDETRGDITTYWVHENDEWKEYVTSVYPGGDDAVNRLQYAFSGVFFIICGQGVTPFSLEIRRDAAGDEDIFLEGISALSTVSYDITKPDDCPLIPENYVRDDAIPLTLFMTQEYSPSSCAFINGRLWAGGCPAEPDRVYVSKPNRDKALRVFDFSTYKLFCTVTPEYLPFQAENNIGSNILNAASDGALGRMTEYTQKEIKHKKVSFGYDMPFIQQTPYFLKGGYVTRLEGAIELDHSSAPRPGEYSKEAAADLRNETAFKMSQARMKWFVPGALCAVRADCDGFEVLTASMTQVAGTSSSVGPFVNLHTAVPYTSWGPLPERPGTFAGAAIMAATSSSMPAGIAVGVSVAGIITVAVMLVDKVIADLFSDIKLRLLDNSRDNPGRDDIGVTYLTSESLQLKCDYLLTKNTLYEPKQPFVARLWGVKEEEYSTPDCGFTFKATSDEKEGIAFMTDMRQIFVATDSSERTLPATVNGAEQSSQTGSFYGAEAVQSAKAADSFYFLQKGGQSILKAAYQPNVPVPSIQDIQKYNKEILRNRKIISLKSAKTFPINVWCVMEDGGAALITVGEGGGAAWSRISSALNIKDTASIPLSGASALRLVALHSEDKGMIIAGIGESHGESGDIYLDAWRVYSSVSLITGYDTGAVVIQKEERAMPNGTPTIVYSVIWEKQNPAPPPPEPGADKYIGYLYTSKMRTLPPETGQALKPVSTKRARLRLAESHLPFIKGHPAGAVNRIVSPQWGPALDAALDGIADVPVPGNVELDAAFEVYTDRPAALSIICMATEEEGG